MSEDLIKYITVKRSAKKKSGYTVKQKDDEYFIDEAPSKARVNEGDKVVAINGIPDDEFMDEDDANALIESIRIVVVPEAKLEEYDEKVADEKAGEDAKGNKGKNDDSDDEEDYEEYERRPKNKGKKAAAAAAVAGAGAAAAANKEESEEEDEEENGAGVSVRYVSYHTMPTGIPMPSCIAREILIYWLSLVFISSLSSMISRALTATMNMKD